MLKPEGERDEDDDTTHTTIFCVDGFLRRIEGLESLENRGTIRAKTGHCEDKRGSEIITSVHLTSIEK